ncbi:MAG: 50S ribosomal protein L17 [Phycisphaerales bacterium]|nr:50S ribosomal protein L17 [Phycisphaerales bacterium]
MSSHRLFGRQLSRDTEHRLAMRRNLVQSLFEHGAVRTTLPKAKEVRGLAEKLINLAKRGIMASGDDAARVRLRCRRRIVAEINDRRLVDEKQEFLTGDTRTVVQRLFNEIAPKFKDRNGGYTRITKTSDFRIGDGGSLVVLSLTADAIKPRGTIRKSAGLRRKRNAKRVEFARKVLKSRKTEPAAETAPS